MEKERGRRQKERIFNHDIVNNCESLYHDNITKSKFSEQNNVMTRPVPNNDDPEIGLFY